MTGNVEIFDYVIIGAGSAGCILANRLSACGRYSVCVIEAGPKDYPLQHNAKLSANHSTAVFAGSGNHSITDRVDFSLTQSRRLRRQCDRDCQ